MSVSHETEMRAEFDAWWGSGECEKTLRAIGWEAWQAGYARGMARMRNDASNVAANWLGGKWELAQAISKLPAASGRGGGEVA